MVEKTESDFCVQHRERLKFFCFTDEASLCVVCANYENHRDHEVQLITEIVIEQEKLKEDLQQGLL